VGGLGGTFQLLSYMSSFCSAGRRLMRLAKGLAFGLFAVCASLAAFAQQSVSIGNTDGTFSSNAGSTLSNDNTLFLNGTSGSKSSTLGTVTGLGSGYNCGVMGSPICSGTVALSTGTLLTGGTLVPLGTAGSTSNPISMFGSGGTFDVTENAGGGLSGFTFSGNFTSASWFCATGENCTKSGNTYRGSWTLSGTIMDGVLTIGGSVIDIGTAVTVQLTTAMGSVTYTKNSPLKFTDSGGNTSFPSPVPEPGTLTLLGSGLIAVGVLSRRLGSRA
jgi:hypothetical protein